MTFFLKQMHELKEKFSPEKYMFSSKNLKHLILLEYLF